MTQVISLVAPPKAMTPVPSTPMDLDDYDRPKSIRGAVVTPDSSPSPRSPSLVRKRAASINTSDASYARFEQLNLNTPSSMNSDNSKDLICLCAPAPKIPRPRNAFILYRQHHQAKVVAQNPTLSNPEISKIIGEQWKEESETVKDEWKLLADEEKQRHAQQYPDYRYQPRRGAKGQGARLGSSPTDESGRCAKCNGRSIATPRTPSTPYPTPTAAKPGMPPFTPSRSDAELARLNLGVLRYAQHPRQEIDDYDAESPEVKRRRFNSVGSYHTVMSPDPMYDGRQYGSVPRGQPLGAPVSGRAYASTPIPEFGPLTRSRTGPMPPPPRPSMPWAEQGPRSGRHATFDESLRLPPLQTSVPMSPSVGTEVDIRQLTTPIVNKAAIRDPQARSVEAMVMSIPFTRKLGVLSRINQPLSVSHPTSPALETRGAIIAIEGPNPRMLQQVGQVVEKALLASNEIALKTWTNDTELDRRGSDASQSDDEHSPTEALNVYAQCFPAVLKWHQKSKQIIDHVLHRSLGSPEPSDPQETEEDVPSRRGSTDSAYFDAAREKTPTSKVPVALLKEGFSLTLSDRFACTVPISDSYAPVDHWQWMATLWRGVVGPDLVVYVKPSVDEEIAKFGTVDFQKQPGLIVVRIPAGKDLDEATERRVAFEVIEWMRGGSFREGAAKM